MIDFVAIMTMLFQIGEMKTHRKELLKLKMKNDDVWQENDLSIYSHVREERQKDLAASVEGIYVKTKK